MNQCHGQRQALTLAQGKRFGQRVHDAGQTEPPGHPIDAPSDLVVRYMEESCVPHKVLADRQFGIEGKTLRHVADSTACGEVLGVDFLTEQPRLSVAGRQQAGQHLHRCRLAATVGAEEAENLAALDAETYVVDRHEIAEPFRQVAGFNGHLSVVRRSRRNLHFDVPSTLLLRKKRDERRF